jgi:hypothetical protein
VESGLLSDGEELPVTVAVSVAVDCAADEPDGIADDETVDVNVVLAAPDEEEEEAAVDAG